MRRGILIWLPFVFNETVAAEFTCKNYKMDYILNNKIKKTSIKGCFKKSKNPQFVSKDCRSDKCLLVRKIRNKKWKVPMPYPRQGSPHFIACYEVNGLPSIVNIMVDKRRKFSLCRMGDSFIDGYTTMLYVKRKMDRLKKSRKKGKLKSRILKI
ncbi:MAG: hypothetical protein OXB84_01410 [Halobacteriovoraceae bacterium]|nr:hypothetical protein [Halobacteriovoraceae bacterium]